MTTTDLITKLEAVRAKLAVIPVRLGIPQYQGLVVLIPNTTAGGSTQTLITPTPKVEIIKPGAVQYYLGEQNVLAYEVYHWVRNVNRTYSEVLLRNSDVLINAVLGTNGTYNGTRCVCVWLDLNKTLSYDLLVKETSIR